MVKIRGALPEINGPDMRADLLAEAVETGETHVVVGVIKTVAMEDGEPVIEFQTLSLIETGADFTPEYEALIREPLNARLVDDCVESGELARSQFPPITAQVAIQRTSK